MRLIAKINSCECKGDKVSILLNIEDFKRMLDDVNPRILCDYLYERLSDERLNERKEVQHGC